MFFSKLSVDKVQTALQTVVEPTRGKDIVSLGLVSGVAVKDGTVIFCLETEGRKPETLNTVKQAAEAAVVKLKGVKKVQVILTSERKAPASAPPVNAGLGSHKISSRPPAPKARRIIAVASGKGGVGKSTVAANLAKAMAMQGKRVGLLDADIYGASQPRMMGVSHVNKPPMNAQEMIIPPEAHGMKVMSIGFFVDAEAPVIWRGPMVHSAVQQLLRDVEWGDLDVLVIDTPPGTGDIQLSLLQNVPLAGAVIVSTPQDVAFTQAKKSMAMFKKLNVPVLGIVENMSGHVCSNCGHHDDIFGQGTLAKQAVALGADFLGAVPLSTLVCETGEAGEPMVAAHPENPAAAAFVAAAERVLEKLA